MEAIMKYINDYLVQNNLVQISAVAANALLAKVELLNDSSSRPGKPLRDLLRKNRIPHAFQSGNRWFIPRLNVKSESHVKSSIGNIDMIDRKASKDNNFADLLFDENFKDIGLNWNRIPSSSGIYCIKIKDKAALPKPFNVYLDERGHNVIYIGIATKNLKTRLGQELLAKGPGTFFRTLGAILNYRPLHGSLIGKSNTKNYKFQNHHRDEIIEWINKNLEINWVKVDNDFEIIENDLIKTYKPILNSTKNPLKIKELSTLRDECRKIANSIERL